MSHIPNKPTIIAAALYGASTPLKAGTTPLAWSELSESQTKPFFKAAEFLGGQVFGASIQRADRAKLAAGLVAQKLDTIDADPEQLVSIFISISSTLIES